MLGRSVVLLAGLFALISPIVPAGQDTPIPGVQPGSARALNLDVPPSRPVRIPTRPIRPIAPYPKHGAGLSSLTRAAGTIFSGTVTRVERKAGINGQTIGTVNVTFHIDDTIRGATPGREFTISEWSGLWQTEQPYRVGEHVLVFLYPRSQLGLTSCVSGPIGRFEMDPQGNVLLSPQHLLEFRKDPVLGGRSRVPFSDFASAVRQASEEE